MAVLCKPAIAVPEYVITQDDTLELARRLHKDHSQLRLILRLIENTGVLKRHLIQPIDKVLKHPGLDARSAVYEEESKARVPAVVRKALDQAELEPRQIDLIVYVSCTGFMMPAADRLAHQHPGLPVGDTADTDSPARLCRGGRRDQPGTRLLPGVPRGQRADRRV